MGKNLKICLSSLGVLGCLGLLVVAPAFGAEVSNDLLVTSHVIRVNQGLIGEEEETFYYGIVEEIEIQNQGLSSYQGDFVFWVGEGEELQVNAFDESGNDTNLEALIEEGVARIGLEKGVFIDPGRGLRVAFDYKVFFTDAKQKEEFSKKIFYPHAKESLQFQVNPVENLGYRPSLLGFPMEKSAEEGGWFVSSRLSPKTGEVYSLTITGDGEVPSPSSQEGEEAGGKEEAVVQEDKERGPVVVSEEIGKLPEQIRTFSVRVKRWIWENILLVIVLNNVFILGVVGYKCDWFERFRPWLPEVKFVKRRRGGKSIRKKEKI